MCIADIGWPEDPLLVQYMASNAKLRRRRAMAIYIGVDPGASGGIAALDEHGRVILATAMPDSDREILDVLGLKWIGEARAPAALRARAYLEKVWSSPGWGHVGAFRFGVSYGLLRMALQATGLPFDEVLPREWQKRVGVSYPKAKGKPRDKNITKRRAEQLFSGVKVTHAIADALLLAEYGRRIDGRFHASEASQSTGGHDGEENQGRAQDTTEARREENEDGEASGASEKTSRQARPARRGTDAAGTRRSQGSCSDAARQELRG